MTAGMSSLMHSSIQASALDSGGTACRPSSVAKTRWDARKPAVRMQRSMISSRSTSSAVAGLDLGAGGAVLEHPAEVGLQPLGELVLVDLAGGPDRREDAAARGLQLLVGRAAGAQLELRGPVAGEARVGVAVDQTRHGDHLRRVDDDAVEGHLEPVAQLVALPDGDDDALAGGDPDVPLEDLELAEVVAAQRGVVARRADELGQARDDEVALDLVRRDAHARP